MRRVLVTGAASGLGLELVRQFAAGADRVWATDLAEQPPAELPAGVRYQRLDVRSDADFSSVRDEVLHDWGGVDVVVNNAGVAAGGRFERIPISEWQWLLDINLMGVVRGCHTFAPVMAAQGGGRLVNIASIAGLCHAPSMASYNVSKAGVVALSETLARELGPQGIRVSVVCPFFFRSNLADSLPGSDPQVQAQAERLIRDARASAAQVAGRVIDGIDKNREVIFTDRTGRAMWLAKRYAGPLYRLGVDRLSRPVASTVRAARR